MPLLHAAHTEMGPHTEDRKPYKAAHRKPYCVCRHEKRNIDKDEKSNGKGIENFISRHQETVSRKIRTAAVFPVCDDRQNVDADNNGTRRTGKPCECLRYRREQAYCRRQQDKQPGHQNGTGRDFMA